MDVGFSDSFFKSFKKMINRARWYWKLWDLFRYDIPNFFRNLWHFRKVLWSHKWYDWRHTMDMTRTSLEMMEKKMHDGIEVRESRDKKIAKMQRAIFLMKAFGEDDFITMAEKELGAIVHHPWEFEEVEDKPGFSQIKDQDTPEEREHNSKVYKRAREIEEELWAELWNIFKGQDTSKFEEAPEGMHGDDAYDHWQNQFDGSGLRGWWD